MMARRSCVTGHIPRAFLSHSTAPPAWRRQQPGRPARPSGQGKGGRWSIMATQRTAVRARRPPMPPRRVVLEPVARRDAAQRLSLALTLLARGGAGASGTDPAPQPPAAPSLPASGASPGKERSG